jgi:acetyl esterase
MATIEKDFPLSEAELKDWEHSQKALAVTAKIPVFLLRRYFTKHLDTQRAPVNLPKLPESKFSSKITETTLTVNGESGDFKLFVYVPEHDACEKLPLFYFIHGGGFIAGSAGPGDNLMKLIADRAKSIAVSVDYHLAPEARFPEPLDDCQKGLQCLLDRNDLDIDNKRITIAGDSAGGNLAAALVIKLAGEKTCRVSKQVLFYPVTDLLDLKSKSYRQKELEYKAMHKFILAARDMYLSSKADRANPLASPICARFAGPMPDALIMVAERDGLRDDGLNYGRLLARSGTKVRSIIYKGAFHAFLNHLGSSEIADDSFEEMVRFVSG